MTGCVRPGFGTLLRRLILFLLIAAGPACAQAPAPLDFLASIKGDHFRFQSLAVGRPFHIYVRLPQGYAADPDRRYPVVYLLDGDTLYPMLAPQHLLLGYDEGLPEALIVGIAYGAFDPAINRRDVDFAAPAPGLDSAAAGAPAFQRFLRDELLPLIEARYRADPARRVLVGQSLGASFVLYSAFSDPGLFWGRIASNPVFARWRALFHGAPPSAANLDTRLAVVSGSRDRRRDEALDWFEAWRNRAEAPWSLNPITLEGGTHAADIANAYRAGMLWLFEEAMKPERVPDAY